METTMRFVVTNCLRRESAARTLLTCFVHHCSAFPGFPLRGGRNSAYVSWSEASIENSIKSIPALMIRTRLFRNLSVGPNMLPFVLSHMRAPLDFAYSIM